MPHATSFLFATCRQLQMEIKKISHKENTFFCNHITLPPFTPSTCWSNAICRNLGRFMREKEYSYQTYKSTLQAKFRAKKSAWVYESTLRAPCMNRLSVQQSCKKLYMVHVLYICTVMYCTSIIKCILYLFFQIGTPYEWF